MDTPPVRCIPLLLRQSPFLKTVCVPVSCHMQSLSGIVLHEQFYNPDQATCFYILFSIKPE